jgi:outer membrane protein TolC
MSYTLDDATKTMLIEADLPNADLTLRPGMYANVKVGVEKHSDALTIPVEALVMEKVNAFAFVAAAGKAEKDGAQDRLQRWHEGRSVERTDRERVGDFRRKDHTGGRSASNRNGGEVRTVIYDLRFAALTIAALVISLGNSLAQPTNAIYPIDLLTVLRLAGAQNLDIQIARERLAEARANHGSAVAQFFPTLTPGIAYRRHDDNIQDVAGNVFEVHKQSYAPGAIIGAQVDIGEAIYKQLAAKQLVHAADHAVEAQRQETTATSAQLYFDLLAAQAAIGVAAEAVGISSNYESQVEQAVGAGLAFKGEQLRVRVQTERNQLALRRAIEERRNAATKLAQSLHLEPSIDLFPRDTDLVPVMLLRTNLSALLQQAFDSRPELKQSSALVASARETKNGTTYGPLVPSIGAQAFFGGLGGGKDNEWGNFDHQQDYVAGLSWRIGPGGLFDFDRQRAARARMNAAQLSGEKLRDEISRQVVDASTRAESLSEQLDAARRAMTAAEQTLQLTQQRREFGVGHCPGSDSGRAGADTRPARLPQEHRGVR